MTPVWFVLVESNTTGTGRLFARAARGLGLRPILLAAEPSRYAYAVEDQLDVVQVDTQALAALRDVCRSVAAEGPIAGVTSSSEYFMATAAALAAELKLPGPDPLAISACRDKYTQRLRLQAAGVRVPAFRVVDTVAELASVIDDLAYPVVVKPVYGSGSVGVRYCTTPDQADAHGRALLAQGQNERGIRVPSRVLFEAWVDGPEYSVELFHGRIVGITAKHLGPLPHFVEVGHDFPATLALADVRAIEQVVGQMFEALPLRWGPAHLELRLSGEGPVIIELNPRLAGGFIPELVRLSTGIDLILATVRLAAGVDIDPQPAFQRAAAIRFLTTPCAGVLAAVDGMEQARRLADVESVEIYRRPGDAVQHFGDFRDRIGHVIAVASTTQAAAMAAEHAHRSLSVEIR